MRPTLRFLTDELAERIIAEARDLLCGLGLGIHSKRALGLLGDHGARVDAAGRHAWFTSDLIDRALDAAPPSFELFDAFGNQTHDLGGDRVHFTPASSAIYYLDPDTGRMRRPTTADYVRYAKVVSRLPDIAAQSTAFIPADVPTEVQDSYRLFLGLFHCAKPIITGAFSAAGFALMQDLLMIVRGSPDALAEKPFAIFSCAPTTPLTWSETTSENLLDCAVAGIPVEIPTMPLAGFTSPVTVAGTLALHAAETMSGVILAQLAAPGAKVLYGGSPAPFDIRYETTPMGAAETWLMDAGLNEIGKRLNLPTQAYMALSDAKALDAQAGLETGMGAVVAVLSGINSISGPGMLDFENCQSVEKLVVDHEIVGLALRLARGIIPREDFPVRPRIEELLSEKHLLISEHSLKHLAAEHHFPGPILERANQSRWLEEGASTLPQRARDQADALVASWQPPGFESEVFAGLIERMTAACRAHGQDELPELDN
ncbi:MAG: trimethylamine methyltransferase family protein [Gemmatimonadales bacterium]|nr:trimethylamine methyltransferase family protein [Gemmatimonadales bacterium]